jgi:hypothetical protein
MERHDEIFKCIGCGHDKLIKKDYYKSYDKTNTLGIIPYCKDCLRDMSINKNGDIDIVKLKAMLKKIDRPFLVDYWEKSIESKGDTFGIFFKNLSLKQNRELTWKDSIFNRSNNMIINNNEDIIYNEENDEDKIKELKKIWGQGYEVNEYESLQNFYDEFVAEYESDSPAQRLNFKNAAKTQFQADKALANGKINEYNQLMKTLSSILGDSNVKPVQATGAEANDQITFGTLLKKYEDTRPVEEEIEDEMKKYIDTFMVGHLAKMEGLNNEMVDKYNEALEEFTIDFNTIHEFDEEDE